MYLLLSLSPTLFVVSIIIYLKAAEREAAERAALEEERRQARVRKPRPSKPVKQPIWRDPDKKPEELHKLSKKLVASTHKSNR